MPAPVVINLQALGDRELEVAINALPVAIAKRLLRSSLRKGFKVTFERVKATVPRRSGALARSLRLRAGGAQKGTIRYSIFTGDLKELGYREVKRPGLRGGRMTPRFPPAAIEFGYVRGGSHSRREYVKEIVDSLGRKRAVKRVEHKTTGGVRVPPLSFMRAPLESTKEDVFSLVAKDLWEGIEEAAKESAAKNPAGSGA